MDLWEFYKQFSIMVTTALLIFYVLNIPVHMKPLTEKRGIFYFKKRMKKINKVNKISSRE